MTLGSDVSGRNYIADEWRQSADSEELFEQRNPADLEAVTGRWPRSSPADVDLAITAAEGAYRDWSAATVFERARLLRDALHRIDEQKHLFEHMIVTENGKTQIEARTEIAAAIREFDHQIEEGVRLYGEEIPSSMPGVVALSRRVPLGVTALITPWNFPLNVPARKMAPALVTGNTCVLKPSSLTPGVANELARCFEHVGMPAGVVNVVHGGGSVVGRALVTDPRVKAVSFTGSTPVGSDIHALAATNLTRTQLEMGGKNPLVILADADLDLAADAAITAAFACAGQWCTATSRVIVERPIFDAFAEAIRTRAERIEVGPGNLPTSTMGPVCGRTQLEGVLTWIGRAKNDGARLFLGGGRPTTNGLERGCFIEPTVFTRVTPDMAVAQEEVFGPVLALIKASGFDDAIEIANAVKFGLSSSVFTTDLEKAMRFVDRTDVGLTHVNLHSAYKEPQTALGGTKHSGVGIPEAGRSGLEFFTRHKVAYIKYH